MSPRRLRKLYNDLATQKYKPKPSKRIAIPKPKGGIRYLGVASIIDKIVQGAILNFLEPLVDGTFSPSSFGFRPGKGCHDALHAIKYKWQTPA